MRHASALLMLLLAGNAASAQTAPTAPTDTTRLPAAVRIDRAREIALARSAAPVPVADHASVWVLADSGYVQAVQGTNGFGCIVQRGTSGRNLIPRCDDANGVQTIHPVFDLLEQMRAAGATLGEYRRALGDNYRTGKFQAPRWGGISYMYSTDVVFPGPNGQNIQFTPHIMIYWPNCKLEDLGMSEFGHLSGTGISLLDMGSPECHLIVNTPGNTARTVEPSR